MWHIHLISVGKLKESFWVSAEAEYLKRIKPYIKFELTELTEEPFSPSDDPNNIKKKESQSIQKHIRDQDVIIALHERGKEMDSIAFSKLLEETSQQGGRITFIIGGPRGLHQSILDRAHMQLSLSQLTFPHQFVRILFLEQLYRAVTISKEKNYHY